MYVIRHARTESNLYEKIMGHIDSPIVQKSLNKVLSSVEKINDVDFDAVYTSDLGRAFRRGMKFVKN